MADHTSHTHTPHAHRHTHGSQPHAVAKYNTRFLIGVGLNVTFVAVEATAGVMANSMALLADAGHNLGDVLGLMVAWGAQLMMQKKRSDRRTYGFKRASILAAMINGLVLLVAIGGIVWESLRRLREPADTAAHTVIWVAAVGIVINTATALLFFSGRKSDLNIRGAFMHMAADALVSAGVVVAGVALLYSGQSWIDPVVSLSVAMVIFWGTWSLLRESADLALDAVPRGIDPDKVRDFLAGRPGVNGLHDLHIWALSTTETALTAHLICTPGIVDDPFLASIDNELKKRFGIGHMTLQIESGSFDSTQSNKESAHD